MREPPNYKRFPMMAAAWQVAIGLIDDRGNLSEDVSLATTQFLKRKACCGLDTDDCAATFRYAVDIAREATLYRRSRCGHNQPLASRRYELLHTLALQLEEAFTGADQFLIMSGCRLVEMYWDR